MWERKQRKQKKCKPTRPTSAPDLLPTAPSSGRETGSQLGTEEPPIGKRSVRAQQLPLGLMPSSRSPRCKPRTPRILSTFRKPFLWLLRKLLPLLASVIHPANIRGSSFLHWFRYKNWPVFKMAIVKRLQTRIRFIFLVFFSSGVVWKFPLKQACLKKWQDAKALACSIFALFSTLAASFASNKPAIQCYCAVVPVTSSVSDFVFAMEKKARPP